MWIYYKFWFVYRPISIEFLSKPEEVFSHCANQVVNYEDPNLNVSIPVFSIHGNHDDPSGKYDVQSLSKNKKTFTWEKNIYFRSKYKIQKSFKIHPPLCIERMFPVHLQDT